MSDGFAHPADFAVSAFGESDLDPGMAAFGHAEAFDMEGVGRSVVEGDAEHQAFEGIGFGVAGEFGEVGARDLVGGVKESIGEIAVVGEEKQAFGFVIEATDGIDPFGDLWEEIEDGGTAEIVVAGGDISARLVEEEIDFGFGGGERFAVDGDGVLIRVNAHPDLCGFSVDLDLALEDHLFGFAARGDPGFGKDFLQAFALRGVFSAFLLGRGLNDRRARGGGFGGTRGWQRFAGKGFCRIGGGRSG